jgi:hypothetical protein
LSWVAVALHTVAKTGMNKRNLFYPRFHCSKALTTNDERRHTTHPINRGNRNRWWYCLHVGTLYETRSYCSFIGNRFPVYMISLSVSTIATVSYWTGRREKNGSELGSSSRVFPRVGNGCGPGPDTFSAVPSSCATLCRAVRSVHVSGRSKTVTCPITTIPPKLFLVNRHRVISNRPGPINRTEV